MDTITAPAIAEQLGVSLPTVHRLLDREGVPRLGRGRTRVVPVSVFERIRRARGTAPALPIPAVEGRILAALLRSPHGLGSARRVAELASVSPTAASRHLRALLRAGLVSHHTRRVAEHKVIDKSEWRVDTKNTYWPELAPAIRSIRLPEHRQARSDSLPRWLKHHFWNADPKTLTMRENGAYIARRLLNSGDAAAVQWALTNADPQHLRDAVAGRGADVRTKALVQNWLAA
jgi:DNA-binding MarR family transcriptional regulator